MRKVDAEVQAWSVLDPKHALAQARAADEERLTGRPTGLLHGVPVGIKDIIDTADMPTENGSVLHAGRTPSRDAHVGTRLRGAGAVMFAVTVAAGSVGPAPGGSRNEALTIGCQRAGAGTPLGDMNSSTVDVSLMPRLALLDSL